LAAGRYVTTSRITELARQLGPRDVAIIDTLASLGAATAAQLERLHFDGLTPASAARQRRAVCQRLHTAGVLARLGRRIGGARGGSAGFIYTLDIAGQRLTQVRHAGRPRRPRTPSPQFLDHTLAVTETYVQLIELTRQAPLQLACFHTEPDCWRQFLGPYGQLVVVKPDAYIALRADSYEDRYFIEVDLATESTTTMTHKAETYRRYWASGTEQAAHGVFPLVLFLVPDQPRQTQLENIIAHQPSDAQRLYHVATYDQAIQVFRAGAIP
jgi:protein involved in plasmid replication-relaxation